MTGPLLAIVMAAYDEAGAHRPAARRAAGDALRPRVRPVVVDDGSTDDTAERGASGRSRGRDAPAQPRPGRRAAHRFRAGASGSAPRSWSRWTPTASTTPPSCPRLVGPIVAGRRRLRAGLALPRHATTTPAARATSASAASPALITAAHRHRDHRLHQRLPRDRRRGPRAAAARRGPLLGLGDPDPGRRARAAHPRGARSTSAAARSGPARSRAASATPSGFLGAIIRSWARARDPRSGARETA